MDALKWIEDRLITGIERLLSRWDETDVAALRCCTPDLLRPSRDPRGARRDTGSAHAGERTEVCGCGAGSRDDAGQRASARDL